MKGFLTILLLINTGLVLPGQIFDDFSDADLSLDPVWSGDTSDFIVSNGELKLEADQAGISSLHTPLESHRYKIWQLDFRLEFSPSEQNMVKIFLWSTGQDPDTSSGYYISLGEPGSDDRLLFFRQEAGQSILLAVGEQIWNDHPHLTLRVELEEETRIWTIMSRSNESTIFKPEIQIEEENILSRFTSVRFALHCIYTSSRSDRFFFDNVMIDSALILDTTGPGIQTVQVLDPQLLKVTFTEAIDSSSALNPENYRISPSAVPIGQITLVDLQSVNLHLLESLTPSLDYLLQTFRIMDLSGNTGNDETAFVYSSISEIRPFAILINEIYDDPTPSFGLPSAEYIELWVDRTQIDVDSITQLILGINDRRIEVPTFEVPRSGLVVLTDLQDHDQFSREESAVGVANLPTLVNSGNEIQLLNVAGELIHEVSYDDDWYDDGSKSGGGWSLELVNPKDYCALAENWRASTSLFGGTPGYENSVLDLNHLNPEFELLRAVPTSTTEVYLLFNRVVDQNISLKNFLLSGDESQVTSIERSQNGQVVTLDVYPELSADRKYHLEINQVHDCLGSLLVVEPRQIWIPQDPVPGDLVINEILFNPLPGGADYVEIYNRSSKAFRIDQLAIAANSNQTQQIRTILTPAILAPGTFHVFTSDRENILRHYTVEEPKNLIQNPLPTMPDKSGNVTLIFQGQDRPVVIDALDYDESMHSSILRDHDGVSLERLDPILPTQDPANWHSASSIVGFGTPTGKNSQILGEKLREEIFTMDPPRLSPDGDGFEDFLIIWYDLAPAGQIAHIRIFDSAGRLTKYLVNNEILGTSGQIKWDGDRDDGSKASIGVYTILFETFLPDGTHQQFKETCIVAGVLN